MEAQIDTLGLLAQPKKDNKFNNKKQPELPENQTVWKSDNQGVKEETFIQTDKRGGDRQPGGGWQTWSQIHLRINPEEQLGSKTDHTTQGSSMEKQPQNL